MMPFRIFKLGLFVLFSASFANINLSAQEVRPRLVPEKSKTAQQPSNNIKTSLQQRERNSSDQSQKLISSSVISQPRGAVKSVLTNNIFVRPTVSSRPVAATANGKAASGALAAFQQKLLLAMYSRTGIPYRYGSEGPATYDCSGLVWDVFKEAGIDLQRTSAANMWSRFETVSDEDKYKFGTLVFFNRLGHVGIVIDENTFFQASSSQGVTFSKFEGYWEKRIVGFRRAPLDKLLASFQK